MWQGNHRLHLVVCGLGGALLGSSVTLAVASKFLERKYLAISESEIQAAKRFYAAMDKTDLEPPVATEEELVPQPASNSVEEAISAYREYVAEEEPEEKPEPTIVNMFQHHTPPGEEVLDALMADRDPDEPYIITKAEFLENAYENDQKGMTYFEGDGVLMDDADEYNPVPDANLDTLVGQDNLLRFGYGSGDENTLYVRNENVGLDFFITKSEGKYGVEVLGFDNEPGEHLEHSKNRKFRNRDD